MATLVLAAAGGALGGSLGGGVLGLSSVAVGKAVGASFGAALDQRLFGAGSSAVEAGRRDQLRITGSREGAAISRVWGQMRIPGQIIWSSRFHEDVRRSGGGKGTGGPARRDYSYSISLAVALCEGEITRIGRIWADGQVIDASLLDMRVYPGSEDQLPDPLIAASLPDGEAPAFRGTAYVVIENLELGAYGNRIPQFNFEVLRRSERLRDDGADPMRDMRAVALVPGTGEYALATVPVTMEIGKGESTISNVNNDQGRPDAEVAIDNLVSELPGCGAVSLVVSWFGSDLRCGECRVEPKVEQTALDGTEMAWTVSGRARAAAAVVSQVDGRPGFGGTPADASVVQAIEALRSRGQSVMFYPFLLMDIRAGNGLPDPWGSGAEQPPVPWRGRITCSVAPGRDGTPDKTMAAATEVSGFFGTAQVSDFAVVDGKVSYTGPAEWSYRRFILHYAHLCLIAGGVDAFCVGSELRGLTRVRDGAGGFPAVAELRALAADVRAVLGPDTKISYAADWSEYFGYHPADGSGDVLYNLDPFWADPNVDFVGIDNYMPLSDWRDGTDHADAAAGSIHDLDYLWSNIAGGEGYDWYYPDRDAREAQRREPISDGAYGMPWVFRYKDIHNWWARHHWNRPGGVLDANPTDWEPESKPIWFTEIGCPAIDKGTNQPNVFVDPQSSENAVPRYSNGGQDRLIQRRYHQAIQSYWTDSANNPVSRIYDAPMVDMNRAFAWAWDARPWPDFPRRLDVWSDGGNHALGHWISGRAHMVELRDVVEEICASAGLPEVDTERLFGVVQGYEVTATETARQSLQPLMLAYGFDAFERDGRLAFRNRGELPLTLLDPEAMVVTESEGPPYEFSRLPVSETPGRVRVGFLHPEKDYQPVTAEVQTPGAESPHVGGSDLPIVLSHFEGEAIAARWLAETQVARDRITLRLAKSELALGPGDVVTVPVAGEELWFRIDRVEDAAERRIDAVRVEEGVYAAAPIIPELLAVAGPAAGGAPHVEFLDLPLLAGTEVPHAPHVAASLLPWSGLLAVYAAAQDHDYREVGVVARGAVVGTTLTVLQGAAAGRWSGQSVDIRVAGGELLSRSEREVLDGANAAAIRAASGGDWEVIQFRDAELVADRVYRLSGLLRGQAGTEPLIPDLLPAGADFVLLDGAAIQPETQITALGRERHYRVGPAGRAYSDLRYRHFVATPRGLGLRPFAPVHAGAVRGSDGAILVSWVRRTRLGGDDWGRSEVPLGENSERYLVEVRSGGTLLRGVETAEPAFAYSAAMQAIDGAPAEVSFHIAQISDLYGPGLEARIDFND